jgi:asparagine synthase (glutamine-hydrolysing)
LLLAGDGGDEIFGGNARYSKDWIYARYHSLPSWTRRMILSLVRTLPASSLLRNRLYNFAYRGNLPNPERFYMDDAFASKWGETLGSPQLCQQVSPDASLEVVRSHYERAGAPDELDRLLYVDLKMAIWGNDLPKVMTAARVAGLRVRFPFLDPRLATFTGTLPPDLKVRGLKKRYLFKQAVADLLPNEILQKPKQGFGVPIAEWIRTDHRVREAILDPVLDSQSLTREYVTPAGLRSIVEKHLRGCWDYGGWLWATMVLERWLRAKRIVHYICIIIGFIEFGMVATEAHSA